MKGTIISCNIRFDNQEDGINAWPLRKKFLVEELLLQSPYILCTQEGREPQLRELECELKSYKLVDIHREWIKERMYPCIFVKKTTNIKRSGDFWLSKEPNSPGSLSFGSAFPRLCTWIQISIGLESIYIFNTHLDHTEESVRSEQSKVLVSEIKKIIKEDSTIVLMGDFNTGPNSDVYSFIKRQLKLNDPWSKLEKTEESSFHHFQGEHISGKRIDWILVSENINYSKIELMKQHKDGVYISDHYPVVLSLT